MKTNRNDEDDEMNRLSKEQKITLRKTFNTYLGGIGSMPFSLRGVIMSEFDRAISEMDKLIGSSPACRGTARKCALCGVLARRGLYFNGKRHWLCLECGQERLDRAAKHKRGEEISEVGGS